MRSLQFKTNHSNWLLAGFLFFLLTMGFISEFFQDPLTSQKSGPYKNPITDEFIKTPVSMTVKNRLGTFQLSKIYPEGKPPRWILEHPRRLPANDSTIEKVLSSLHEINIHKVIERDPLNVSSFSLDAPLLTIKIKNKSGKTVALQMGIINSIDNSTYISFENNPSIFQVDIFQHPLETFDLSNFIDSHVFSSKFKDVATIQVFRGKRDSGKDSFLTFQKVQHLWQGPKTHSLPEEKMEELVKNILSVKGKIILDRRTEDLEKILQKYQDLPLYTIEVKEKNNSAKTYVVSNLIHDQLPEIKIETMQNLLIWASDREHPYIISKDYLSYFQPNPPEQKPKEGEISNLFY